MAEYTSDQLRLILAMSADITSLQRSLKKATGDTAAASKQMSDSLGSIGARGPDPTRRMQDSVSKMQGSMRAATGNMTAQLNDITTTLLSGSSPFTVMVQQGSQVTQILQEMAATAQRTGQSFSVFKLVGSAFMNLISPMSLVVNGLILIGGLALPKVIDAAKEWFGVSEKNAKAMKAEAEALQSLTKEYGDLVPMMKKLQDARDAAAKRQDIAGAAETAKADIWKPSIASVTQLGDALIGLQDRLVAVDQFDQNIIDMGNSFDTVFEKIKDGTVTVEELNQLIANLREARVRLDDPSIDKLVTTVESIRDGLAKTKGEAAQVDDEARSLLNTTIDAAEAAQLLAETFGLSAPMVKGLLEGLETLSPELQKIGSQIKEQLANAFEEAAKKQKVYDDAMKSMEETARGPLTDVEKVLEQHRIALENATGAAQKYQAELAKTDALSQLNIQASEKLADVTLSNMDDYSKRVATIESGGRANAKNPLSSASGMFQFLDSTFLKVARSMDEFAALTDQQIMAQKNNVEMQKKVFDKFTADNAAALGRANLPITNATLYLAHFLGAGGATRLLRADPGRPAAQVLGPGVARANPTVVGGGKTVQDVINWAERKMGGAGAQVSLADQKATTDSAREEAEIRGEIGVAMDENIRKQEEALKFAELRRDLEKKAAEEGRAVSQEEIAHAREIAAAWGKTKGAVAGHKKELADAKNLADALRAAETKTDEINAELNAVNALGIAYDEMLFKKEKAGIISVLTAKASADGTAATQEEAAAIERVADAQAKALATQAAYKQGQKDLAREQKLSTQQAEQLAETYAGMATQFFSGFISDLRNGKDATEALSDALGRLGDQLLDMALNMLFKQLFGSLFGVAGGAGGGGGVGLFKAGGTVGLSRHSDGRRFSPLLWAGAPKFQTGGMVGLRPGEIPIIAHRGELVIPAGMANQNKGGSVTGDDNRQYNIGIKVDSNGRANLTEGNGTILGKRLNLAVQEVIAKEQRSGGLLSGTGPGRR